MSAITTHVLDTSRGRPAVGFQVGLQLKSGDTWKTLGAGLTDANGRCAGLLGETALEKGTYRLLFNAGDYYRELHLDTLYSEISIVFEVSNPETHYHVPLLINPFGYSTYRGS
jgi:5-hydroxyisourate hydrolase